MPLLQRVDDQMSTNYIDRSHDEEIIDIVRSVMDNGTGKAQTANEYILIKLMQLRGTPMSSFEFDQERVDFHYNLWVNNYDRIRIQTNLDQPTPPAYETG